MFIKRDDALIPSFSGNKVRKLEFIIGDAIAKKSNTLVTSGHTQSIHARLTAMVARKLGLDVSSVLYSEKGDKVEDEERSGNLLLDVILGAKITYVDGYDAIDHALSEVVHGLRQNGRRPYLIPTAGYAPLGALGHVNRFAETDSQAAEMGIKASHILTASGSGGTQSGLVLGKELSGKRIKILGISDGAPKGQIIRNVMELTERTRKLLFASDEKNQVTATGRHHIAVYDEVSGKSIASLKGRLLTQSNSSPR